MLIDTHAHIYLDDFEDELEEVLDRAHAAGVDRIVMPAIDVASVEKAILMSDAHEGLYVMAALHPTETKDASQEDFELIVDLCDHPNVVAVGETGLDYYWDRSFDDKQHDFLREHIRLAIEKDLPIVFHNREAFDDLIEVVEDEKSSRPDGDRLRGIFHCFTGTSAEAERIERSGFHVGIGGIVTFKNSELDGAVREIPLTQIVLETDAPYLAPEPYRGQRNEPSYVRYVAEKVAAVRGLSLEDLASATTKNAERVFGLLGEPAYDF